MRYNPPLPTVCPYCSDPLPPNTIHEVRGCVMILRDRIKILEQEIKNLRVELGVQVEEPETH